MNALTIGRVAALRQSCGGGSLQRQVGPGDARRHLRAACKDFVFVPGGRDVQGQSCARLLPQRKPETTPAFALLCRILMPSERKSPVLRLCLRDFVSLGREYHIRRRKHGSKAIRQVLKTVNVCLGAGTPWSRSLRAAITCYCRNQTAPQVFHRL
jgi:hypothetical protein